MTWTNGATDEQKTGRALASHEAVAGTFKKCLLLYSGGLDTSVMLKWIQEQYKCEVVALTIDIGQTADDLVAIKKKAISLGAVDAVVYDAKKEFAEELCVEAIKANADYQGGYALGCPLGRVMISKIAVKIAEQKGCQVIAHGCTGKGNDQVRFEGYCTTLNPEIKLLAPVRDWGMGRDEELAYAAKHNIPVKQTASSPYSYDENMWANTAEGAEIEDPSQTPKLENILLWCNRPETAPDAGEEVTIGYEAGVPVSLNGEKLEMQEIIKRCNKLAGKHGCGFHILIEDRIVGLKVRGIYENPAASLLILGHKKLEQLVQTREQNEFKTTIDQKWAYLCYGAKYFEPLMDSLRAFLDKSNEKVTGWAKIKLYKGNMTCISVDSPKYTLLDTEMASFNQDFGRFNQSSSPGFIELWNLPQKSAYNRNEAKRQRVE